MHRNVQKSNLGSGKDSRGRDMSLFTVRVNPEPFSTLCGNKSYAYEPLCVQMIVSHDKLLHGSLCDG